MNPKVFVSHASEDKERFVLQFAARLRAKGIDAWVDKWEMYPGDSLVDKIFEEGIKNAEAVIAVLSKHSVNKPWVKEELNASVVKRINSGSLLIPVLIDECEVPEALKSTLWSRIADLSDYDEEFERIVSAIFNRREKPAMASPPKYTRVTVDAVPGLTEIDTLIFIRACEMWMENPNSQIQVAGLYQEMAALEIPENEFLESIEILDKKSYIEGRRVFRGRIPFFRISHFGFDEYLRCVFSGYDAVFDEVCLTILNEKLTDNIQIAQRLHRPLSIINHIMENLNSRGLVRAVKFVRGRQQIFSVSPELHRHYRNK